MTAIDEKKWILGTIGIFLTSLFSLSANALCLRDCETSLVIGKGSPQINYQSSRNSARYEGSFNREKSPNTGDVRNSVLGDVNIRNGHERVEINGIHSNHAMIDTSITSIVNLGDTTNK